MTDRREHDRREGERRSVVARVREFDPTILECGPGCLGHLRDIPDFRPSAEDEHQRSCPVVNCSQP